MSRRTGNSPLIGSSPCRIIHGLSELGDGHGARILEFDSLERVSGNAEVFVARFGIAKRASLNLTIPEEKEVKARQKPTL